MAERVKLIRSSDGVRRWHMDTREGWQVVGNEDGRVLMLDADHFAEETEIVLEEPVPDAK